ncbi:MAG: AsmA family protein [Candidatus Omnitrophica bacterium]|nr:AsmA family protein [Candidatus Omnitrophota bacterium]MDD5500219.1 AsmA family protein [Candidatus Omnitrophota bacterium]
MKKFIIIASALFLLIVSALFYLNKFYLPGAIRSTIVSALSEQTRKDVSIGSLEFSIFKGFILRDLSISDGDEVLVSVKEVDCVALIWPVFRKRVIIPAITFREPRLSLRRLKDNSFNLQELFSPGGKDAGKKGPEKSGFGLLVYKISILKGNLVFRDDTLAEGFAREVKNIQFNAWLALPGSIKVDFRGELAGSPLSSLYISGEYRISRQQVSALISVNNLAIREIEPYFRGFGLEITGGAISGRAKIGVKERQAHVESVLKVSGLSLSKDKVDISMDLGLTGKADYDLKTKKTSFNGDCDIRKADISGLGMIGDLKELYGKVSFNERSLVAQGLKAEILGMPFKVNMGIKDFSTLVLNVATHLDLAVFSVAAREKLNLARLESAAGQADLSVKLYPDGKGGWVIQGKFSTSGADLKLSGQEAPVENITAAIEFSQHGLSWTESSFRYKGKDYRSSGELSDFASPKIGARLSSRDLSLSGSFNISEGIIHIIQAKGKYYDSRFSARGSLDLSDPSGPRADVKAEAEIEVDDLVKIFPERYPALKDMRLKGKLGFEAELSGSLNDLRSCSIKALSSGGSFSAWGLNFNSFTLAYIQEEGVSRITSLRAGFYGGEIYGTASLNMSSPNLPYYAELQAQGIDLEKLKMDTASRSKKISGVLNGKMKLNGFSNDPDKLSGAGDFSVKGGRLWELNLLQGIGKLLFAKDLGSIELSECSCAFLVKDKAVRTDNLNLKGNVAELSGPIKIGFDGSLEGALDVHILSEMVPLSGTLKDVTTALMGKVGKFGVIKLSGSLSEPKYSFSPVVTNILKGLTNMIFGK